MIIGGRKLKGDVRISGAKNAALPILAASLLVGGWNYLSQHSGSYGHQDDQETPQQSWRSEMEGEETLRINAGGITNCEASYDLVRTMRASILVLGPLVARMGEARVSLPGGCAIGARPVNLHIKALRELGAEVTLKDGYVEAKASRLKGAEIYFDISTVTGTENIMMAATLAEGTTLLKNAAREPEVVNLAEVLDRHGGADPRGGERCDHDRRGGTSPSRGGGGHPGQDRSRNLPDRRRHHRRGYPDSRLHPPPSRCADRQTAGYRDDHRPAEDSHPGERRGNPAERGRQDPSLSGLSDGSAGPDHGLDGGGGRAFRHYGNGVREPFHACERDDAYGGGYRYPGEERHRPGGPEAARGAGDGDGSQGLGFPHPGGSRGGGNDGSLRVYHIDRGYQQIEKKLSALGADIRRIPG